MPIRKVLVANRGEIACRVFRTCRERGIKTVAVYSDADADSMHTLMADERVHLGRSEATESYLSISRIIDACNETGADAVHPGYGFLSERAEFVEALEAAGIIFIGPPPSAMRKLGDKISAKQLAVSNNVAITPGFFEAGASIQQLMDAAHSIGFPVMLKASAGGGGRGMRAVFGPENLKGELELASAEALNSFGDGQMMVEKLILKPRHIEVQLMADGHGNVAALYERECSLQRRHQKIIEEAPSPIMTEQLWQDMREACFRLAKAAGYKGAGTVEFMFDDDSGEFYFLEVNARLQVEHPVTEAITGLDLVGLQIDIANGGNLEQLIPKEILDGDRRAIRGHAIESRIVAEDPGKGFMPSIGKIATWLEPTQPEVRVDTGFSAGKEVSRYYDSMLAKVITHGPNRVSATQRMTQALLDFHVLGVRTNITYLLDVIHHPDFATASFDTKYLERVFGDWQPSTEVPDVLGQLMKFATSGNEKAGNTPPTQTGIWSQLDGWRILKV